VWLLLLLGMAGGLLYTMVDLILRYQSNPFTTSITVKTLTNFTWPELTFCLQASVDR
jgi:hypothetical protein